MQYTNLAKDFFQELIKNAYNSMIKNTNKTILLWVKNLKQQFTKEHI